MTWSRPCLRLPGGVRIPIKPSGVVIGRAPTCDVVVMDPGASRVQGIVFAGRTGPSLSVLGKGPIAVNGEPVVHDRELRSGDRIELASLTLEVVAEERPDPSPASTWVVSGPGGLFGVVHTPFVVGGGDADDLHLEGAPAGLLRFHLADRLHVEAGAAITVDGVAVAAGEVHALHQGAIVACSAGRFEVVGGGTLGQDSTAADLPLDLPALARLEFLPRGGRLTVGWRGRERTVYLPERRCDLIATLLRPPAPLAPGALVPDDVALPRIWPGRTMSRVELNVLIHRARNDLIRAELDGTALLIRAEGGNATRFLLASDAHVVID